MPHNNLNSGFRILDGSPLLLAAPADDWDGYEQIACCGAYKGHWQGEFEITEAMLQQMADFGNSKKIETPADYGHELIFNSAADASGWVKPGDFQVRGKGKNAALYAKIAWTERARSKIAAQELKYKSPAINFNTTDRKTGRTGGSSIHSVALTNTPFLHELPEVRLNSIMGAIRLHETAQRAEENHMREGLCKLLGLSTDIADDALLAAATGLSAKYAALTAAIHGDDKMASLAELKAKAATADATMSRVAALEAAEAVREQERKDALALAAVKAAQSEGKILGDDTEHFKVHLALAKQDPARFASLSAVMPRVTPLGAAPVRKPDAPDMDETARAVNAALGLSNEVYKKHLPAIGG